MVVRIKLTPGTPVQENEKSLPRGGFFDGFARHALTCEEL